MMYPLLIVSTIVVIALVALFYGNPSHFQLRRVYKIAAFLEVSIAHAKKEKIIDRYGNLDVVARSKWFLTYKGFFQRDVEQVTKMIAERQGFRRAFVEYSPGFTTFRFKRLHS